MSEKRKLLILGAGQYGQVVRETAESMGSFEEIAFLDDNSLLAVGKMADAEKLHSTYTDAFVAMGSPVLRELWMDKLEAMGYHLPVIRHPQSVLMPSAKIAEGCIMEAMAVVNSYAQVGRGCLICAGAVINHNAVISPYCQIDCNATVAARSMVPKGYKVPCGQVYEKENGV